MTTLEILRSARKLLSNPRRWTKHAWFKQLDDGTVCYCAEGAVAAACGMSLSRNKDPRELPESDQFLTVIEKLRSASGAYTDTWMSCDGVMHTEEMYEIEEIPSWNDYPETTYEDVMALFSKACEAEFEREQQSS